MSWAVEIKRSSVPRVEKGFRVALGDVKPDRAFVLYSGSERYSKGEGVEAIGLYHLAEELSGLR